MSLKIKRHLVLDGATALLVLCAVAITGLTVRRELFPKRRFTALPVVSIENDWKSYTTSGHLLGPANGGVTIVEFSDLNVPFVADLLPV